MLIEQTVPSLPIGNGFKAAAEVGKTMYTRVSTKVNGTSDWYLRASESLSKLPGTKSKQGEEVHSTSGGKIGKSTVLHNFIIFFKVIYAYKNLQKEIK